MEGKTQLIFETGGYCCLCLQSNEESSNKYESEVISSFQSICQYLKLDLAKIFGGGIAEVPLESLPSVEESEIKGTLCSGCAQLSEQFSNIFEELGKIQRQMKSCLFQVHQKILQTDNNQEGNRNTLIQLKTTKFIQSEPETLANLEIVERLQKQIKEKCKEIFQEEPSSLLSSSNSNDQILNGENLADKIKVEIVEKTALVRPHIPLPNLDEEEDDQQEMEEEILSENEAVPAMGEEEGSKSEEEKDENNDDEDEREPKDKKVQLHIPSADQYSERVSCDIRNSTFENEAFLSYHKNVGHPAYQCHFCFKKFQNKTYLLSHQGRYHSCSPLLGMFGKKIRKVEYTCEPCQKTFRSKQRLTEHNDVVHLKIIPKCRFCQQTFRIRGTLTRHIKRRDCAGLRNRKQTPSASSSATGAPPPVKVEVLTAEEYPKPEVKTEQEDDGC